ncbi:hypothetical protein BH23PLA1_BH23PLA1_26070 [soil metagenome]
MRIESVNVRSILTRTSGYLDGIASHSIQPYRGCPFGSALCGVGCYVRHAGYITRGEPWGSFLEAKTNAAKVYRDSFDRESRWARQALGRFAVFMSSATEPFPPQESRLGISRSILSSMRDQPPDLLILQTHSHRVAEAADLLVELSGHCELRVHLSIETDRDQLPGLPPHASSVDRRFQGARMLKEAGLFVVVTVAPLLPIADPEGFFGRIARSADAVVLDHFLGGDGSPGDNGSRTQRTPLPLAMAAVEPDSIHLDYRNRMAEIARRHLPGRVGIGQEGFSARWTND